MKICIPGNCQAQHMEMMLHLANPDLEIIRLEPVFLMKQEGRDATYAKFRQADAILTQRISHEYNLDWVTSATLRQEFGDKVIVWPNIYFDGYFPGVQYVYLANWGKLASPLNEYHFEQIRAAHAAGKSVDQAVEAFAGEELFNTTPDPISGSLDQLRAREAEVDIPISDVIAGSLAENRQFYTPNHPVNHLLGVMLQRLTARLEIRFDLNRAENAPYRLDECYIAASTAIVKRFHFPFDHQAVYRGRQILGFEPYKVALGDPCDYDSHSLVTAYYRLYDHVREHP